MGPSILESNKTWEIFPSGDQVGGLHDWGPNVPLDTHMDIIIKYFFLNLLTFIHDILQIMSHNRKFVGSYAQILCLLNHASKYI